MKVLKFGGTSVGSVESLQSVKEIIAESYKSEEMIIVVSAFGGVTSQLEKCIDIACDGDTAYEAELFELEQRHYNTLKNLFKGKNCSKEMMVLKEDLEGLAGWLQGVCLLREATAKVRDSILGYGEAMSSYIISSFLNAENIDTTLLDTKKIIITDENFSNANVDFKVTNAKIKDYFKTAIYPVIAPGFVSSTSKGQKSTLGRGGSDYTAAIIAAALDADALEIWTDVNGMMTADPRLVSSAHSIADISYEEAMELSHFGAKVIYPPSMHPVLNKEIPTYVKNTFEKDNPGTRISSQEGLNEDMICGVSSIKNVALLNLSGSGMAGIPNFSYRIFKSLADAKVNVIIITQASSKHTICVGIKEDDVEAAQSSFNAEFLYEIEQKRINKFEVETNLAIVALVGDNMRQHVGVSGRMFETLGQNGVSIKAIAQGSSERSITALIEGKHLKKALNVLHESFFLSNKKRVNLFIIGVGNVGGSLIGQVNKQYKYLIENEQIDLRVAGVANSKKMHFNDVGIDLDKWNDELQKNGQKMSVEAFISEMHEMNLRNSIFIDNTASKDIPSQYKQILAHTVSVVTPNKIAASSSYADYTALKRTAREFRSKFHFETNVGAGLPVISTLNDLIKSGDKIDAIEAVLSGSLNFIFNNYDTSSPYAEVVKIAQKEGYTEPDPREDLSGMDVKRKILILVRESGIKMELDEVKVDSFVPDDCMNARSVDAFYDKLKEQEVYFKQAYDKANAAGNKLKVVASYKKGIASVSLKEIEPSHPFYHLDGKDNIVLFYTARYREQPLVIKGAGAGAEVTASGIFADIMKIAKS